VLGGGLPAAAYGGRRDLMEQIAPAGPVYQAGTLSGNPLAMAAGLATLEALAEAGVWQRAERWAAAASQALTAAAHRAGAAITVQRVGTMLTPFFTDRPVRDYAGARSTDRAAYAGFFHAMLEHGVYLPPSPFEAAFTSAAHGDEEMEVFARALGVAFGSP
jgi:glutamate-1-semialdehyde 2,1-aminomutase